MSRYPSQLNFIIAYLKRLPGVGRKTAERFAFALLDWPEKELSSFAERLEALKKEITPCKACGCLIDEGGCFSCARELRSPSLLCLVASPRDVYSIEETNAYKGRYHVLGGLISPLDGRDPSSLSLQKLLERISSESIDEVILAFDSTLEGDATALFVKEKLDSIGVKASRLASGIPMGSSLEYVDFGTLEKAFTGRHSF